MMTMIMTEKMLLMEHININFYNSVPLVLTSYEQHIPQVQLLLFLQRDTAVSSEGERSMLVSLPSHPTIYNTLTIKHNWNNFQ